eukprot:scaffold177222_cov37-Tisochrysis_lutea.AAC.1
MKRSGTPGRGRRTVSRHATRNTPNKVQHRHDQPHEELKNQDEDFKISMVTRSALQGLVGSRFAVELYKEFAIPSGCLVFSL